MDGPRSESDTSSSESYFLIESEEFIGDDFANGIFNNQILQQIIYNIMLLLTRIKTNSGFKTSEDDATWVSLCVPRHLGTRDRVHDLPSLASHPASQPASQATLWSNGPAYTQQDSVSNFIKRISANVQIAETDLKP